MDIPTRPGDVLAQPTRADLFALLATCGSRRAPRQARGRPRDVWSISHDAQPGGDPPTAYADLGRWLVRSIAASHVRDEIDPKTKLVA